MSLNSGFQGAFEGGNVFAQSNVIRQRVPGGWSSNKKARRGRMQGMTSSKALEECRARGHACVCTSSLRYDGWLCSAPCESEEPLYR